MVNSTISIAIMIAAAFCMMGGVNLIHTGNVAFGILIIFLNILTIAMMAVSLMIRPKI